MAGQRRQEHAGASDREGGGTAGDARSIRPGAWRERMVSPRGESVKFDQIPALWPGDTGRATVAWQTQEGGEHVL